MNLRPLSLGWTVLDGDTSPMLKPTASLLYLASIQFPGSSLILYIGDFRISGSILGSSGGEPRVRGPPLLPLAPSSFPGKLGIDWPEQLDCLGSHHSSPRLQ